MHVPGADCARLINGLPCPAWGIHKQHGELGKEKCAGLAGWDNTISAGGEQVGLGKRRVRWVGRLEQGHKRTEENTGLLVNLDACFRMQSA